MSGCLSAPRHWACHFISIWLPPSSLTLLHQPVPSDAQRLAHPVAAVRGEKGVDGRGALVLGAIGIVPAVDLRERQGAGGRGRQQRSVQDGAASLCCLPGVCQLAPRTCGSLNLPAARLASTPCRQRPGSGQAWSGTHNRHGAANVSMVQVRRAGSGRAGQAHKACKRARLLNRSPGTCMLPNSSVPLLSTKE